MSQEGGAPPVSLSTGALNSSNLLDFIRQGKSFSGREPNCCFLNTGSGQFANASSVSGLDFEDDGRAVGVVDWDHDGDLDFWITNRNGPQIRFVRNNLEAAAGFVAFRLEGTRGNRDAIGARVELTNDGEAHKQIKTLRAGDGYLSQSSKWLHFGVPDRSSRLSVAVRWPSGSTETFAGISVGQRYLLKEGATENSLAIPPSPTTKPAPNANSKSLTHADSTHEKTIPSSTVSDGDLDVLSGDHVFSVSKLPVPRLPYQDLSGNTKEVFLPGSGKPTLLCLWASWCAPCLAELKLLASESQRLEEAGLSVVALSVDGLDGTTMANTQLSALVSRLDLPFAVGRADAGLVEKMQLVNNQLFDLHLPLPMPTSVLIDGNGRLAGLYRGSISVDRLVGDVAVTAVFDQDPNAHRDRSTGFQGRWHEPLNTISLVPMLNALTSSGFLAEADEYVRRIGMASKSELLPAITKLGIAWHRHGRIEKATKHFDVLRKLDPTYVESQTQLGKIYEDQGKLKAAVQLYRESLQRNPKNLRGLNNLAWLLATNSDDSFRNGAEAVKFAKQANELTANKDPNVLDTLAASYAEAGRFAEAEATVRRAIELSTARGRLAMAEELRGRLKMYQQQKPFRKSVDLP